MSKRSVGNDRQSRQACRWSDEQLVRQVRASAIYGPSSLTCDVDQVEIDSILDEARLASRYELLQTQRHGRRSATADR